MVLRSDRIWRFINSRTASTTGVRFSSLATARRDETIRTSTTSCRVRGALSYRRTPFEIFNLGENQTMTLSDLISAIETALGKKAVIERLPEQEGDMPLTCADIDKARALLGYNPQIKISEGIPRFVEWYLSRQNK